MLASEQLLASDLLNVHVPLRNFTVLSRLKWPAYWPQRLSFKTD